MHRIILHALSHDLCTGPVYNAKETILFSFNEYDGPGTGVHGGGPGVHDGGDSREAN